MTCARDAVRARDAAAAAAGFAFVEAGAAAEVPGFGAVPPLALVSHQADQLLGDASEGTLGNRVHPVGLHTPSARHRLPLGRHINFPV